MTTENRFLEGPFAPVGGKVTTRTLDVHHQEFPRIASFIVSGRLFVVGAVLLRRFASASA